MSLRNTQVLIIDDHAIFRAGLKQILVDEKDIEVVGEAATALEAMTCVENLASLDIVLLDISLPDKTGLDVLKQIKLKNPKLPVLLLSVYPEDQYAIRAFRLGAAGYLTKDCPPELLIGAIRKVVAGGRCISEDLTERLIAELDPAGHKPPHERLSSREFEIFLAIARGIPSSEIAKKLSLSVKTVSTYRSRIMEKMGKSKNADIIRYAIENKIL